MTALRAVRAVSDATLAAKRGALGAVAFGGSIPDSLDDGEAGAGFPIEVFNVLGAGNGFMSGLLKGWLDGEDWPTTLKYANACGAFAVSRHGCTPAYPSWEELQFFFARGVIRKDLRDDAELEQVHWATNRNGDWSEVRVFAFDHRAQLEEMEGAPPDRIGVFKQLCLEATLKVRDGRAGYGILRDGRLGADALSAAEGQGLWLGRPVEWPGSRPLTLEPALGPDHGGLLEWPRDQVIKVLCFCHPDDDGDMWSAQEAVVQRLFHAARRNRLEFLLEQEGKKELLGFVDGARESAHDWRALLLALKRRGLSMRPSSPSLMARSASGRRSARSGPRPVSNDAGCIRPPTFSTSCPRASSPRPSACCKTFGWPERGRTPRRRSTPSSRPMPSNTRRPSNA